MPVTLNSRIKMKQLKNTFFENKNESWLHFGMLFDLMITKHTNLLINFSSPKNKKLSFFPLFVDLKEQILTL